MLIMNDEIRWLTQQPGMARWGTAPGSVILHGQKVPVDRPRLRDQVKEAKLGSYELFRRDEEMQRRVWDKVMRGVSMRSYDPVVRESKPSFGIGKTTCNVTGSITYFAAFSRCASSLVDENTVSLSPDSKGSTILL